MSANFSAKFSENKKRNIILILISIMIGVLGGFGFYQANKESSTEEIVQNAVNEVKDYITTYNMTQEEIKELPSTEIQEQTIEDEQNQEQEVENEGFELQGEIAYEGDRAVSWNVELGDYIGLTYYSQIDSRWSNKMYSSVGDSSQTIGTSGCGPTCASMVVTATKGAITPDTMADLFVKYGYRSSNNGTYWSAFRAIADEFNIGYQETSDVERALQLLQSKNYVVASVGNGLFTTGGHFILLTRVQDNVIEIYDPYLYAGKFETSTRRGKATVNGNKVYVTVDNFKQYANFKGAFCYEYDNMQVNDTKPIITATFTRYVKTNTGIGVNVRNAPNGAIVGALADGTKVTVYETNSNWSRIGNGRWVCSDYLANNQSTVQQVFNTVQKYSTGKYKVTRVSKNSVLCVRTGASTRYERKTYRQLSANARSQNRANGNYYANGYKNGVIFTVTKINGNWGLSPSGWVCLDYCSKI